MEIQLNPKNRLFLAAVTTPFIIIWMILIFTLIYSHFLFNKISNISEEDLVKYKSLDLDKIAAGRVGFMIKDDTNLNLLLADNYAQKGVLNIEDMDEGMKNKIKEELLGVEENPGGKLKNPVRDFFKAIEFYHKAIISNPLSGESHLKLGILYADLKMNDKACQEFERAALLDPTDAYHQFDVGRYFLSIGEYKKGFKSLKRADSFNFQSLSLSLDLVWEVKQSYQDLIEVTPETSPAFLALGGFLLNKGMWSEAVTVYKKAISKDPKNFFLYKFLSSAYEKKDMLDEAIKLWESGIKKNPENPDMYFYLGKIYSKKNELDEALFNIKKAIALSKERVDTKTLVEYHLILGDIYYSKMKDFKKALEESEIVLKLNSTEARGYFLKGLCYKSIDSDPAAMLKSFKKAVYYNPNELQYKIILAETLYIYSLYKEALLEWESIKKFESHEKMAEEKIKAINNAIKEEQRNLLNKIN